VNDELRQLLPNLRYCYTVPCNDQRSKRTCLNLVSRLKYKLGNHQIHHFIQLVHF